MTNQKLCHFKLMAWMSTKGFGKPVFFRQVGHPKLYPNNPCMVYFPTFTIKKQPNVGKYTSPMDGTG